jgi:hypothetical protein
LRACEKKATGGEEGRGRLNRHDVKGGFGIRRIASATLLFGALGHVLTPMGSEP